MSRVLAESLWRARLAGEIVEVPAGDAPTDEASAYALQHAITRIAEADGATVAGYKLGATTQGAIDVLQVPGAFLGPMFSRWCVESGADVALASGQAFLIETEIAAGMRADLPSRSEPYSGDDVADAVEWFAAAFEIVAARFAGGVKGNGPLVIGDSGINSSFVCGSRVTDWRDLDLSDVAAKLTVDGEAVAEGSSSVSVLGTPLAAVTWLANHSEAAPRGLRQGDIVTTGSCTGLSPVKAGQSVSAGIEKLGSVEVSFSPMV